MQSIHARPLVLRALRLLSEWPEGVPGRRLAMQLAGRLYADDLPACADLDVGVWGPHLYDAAAQAALRVQAVATSASETVGEPGSMTATPSTNSTPLPF